MRIKTFTIHGTAEVGVTAEVEVECECQDEDDCSCAEHAFYDIQQRCPELIGFCGNGGSDKLVGVYDRDVSLDTGIIVWEEID